MQDLSNLARGVSDSMAKGQFGDQEGNWGFDDVDPDGGSSFATMDGDAAYPHSTAPSTIGHDHYKKG